MDVVVAVDESGSLSPADLAREISATSTIAQSGMNPRTRVTVIGFGSNNGGPGQVAAKQVCRPTVAGDAVSLQYLSECVGKLHRRDAGEGNDTDHVAALAQALSTFDTGSPDKALKVVFLLTDGRLDVRNSPHYGSGDRNAEAERQLLTHLERGRAGQVQIWPLGFGSDIDRQALARFAAGGSQQACDDRAESKPRARVVRDSGDVLRSLLEAYAAASCFGLTGTETTTLSSKETRELTVRIPVIATDGTITVNKADPLVRVEYVAPDGVVAPSNGTLGESTFTRSGENGETEALRIVNPLPGAWKVRLVAPENLRRRLVSATALWQGAVRSSIVVEPPSALPGRPVVVRLSLLTRRGAITDARALAGLRFSVTATGPALAAGRSVPVRDDGVSPDDRAEDGR